MGLSENKQELNEIVLTLAAVVGAVKVAAGVKAVYDLGKAAFNKYKGEPTEKTDKMPLLDIFNLDPRYSEVLDDRLEEEFINWWQNRIKSKPDGEVVETDELNVNKLLPLWLELKYPKFLYLLVILVYLSPIGGTLHLLHKEQLVNYPIRKQFPVLFNFFS